jgi:hypothetical protein
MRSSAMGDRKKAPVNFLAGEIQNQHNQNDTGHSQNTKHFPAVVHVFKI